MSRSGREALPNVQEWSEVTRGSREALSNVREWSGGLPRYAGVFGRPFQMFGNSLEAILDVREWSNGPPG